MTGGRVALATVRAMNDACLTVADVTERKGETGMDREMAVEDGVSLSLS